VKLRRPLVILTLSVLTVAAGTLAALALSKDGSTMVSPGWSRASYAPKPGSVRIEARAKDPGGDAPWVVRVWVTRDNTQACEQLGREVKGVVGEVGLDGRFRPLEFGERTLCSPRVLDQRAPLVQVATFLDDPLADNSKPLRTVAWGIAGPRADRVTVDAPGGRYTAQATRWRAWLNVRAGDVPTYKMVTNVHYPGSRVQTVDYSRARRPSRHPVPGTLTVAARVAAPKGGPDYGLLAWRTENGSTCSTQGRVLGDSRVGAWDPQGTFFDYPIGEGAACTLPEMLNREQPFAASLSSSWLNSEIVLSGVAAPDVEKVIVDGVGPKRELKPGAYGGVLALFDSKASGRGRLHITAVFKDGTTKQLPTFRIPLWRHGAPRQPHLSTVGPKVVPVTPRGSFTLNVSCSDRPRIRKCISGLYLRSAKNFKRPSGLSYQVAMANDIIRIGRGAKRSLRLHLTRRGRALLNRQHSVAVVASDAYAGKGKRNFRLQLVEQGFVASVATHSARTPARHTGPAVLVRPRSPRANDSVTIAWWVPEPMDNNGDGYRITFRGPGGADCSSTVAYGAGVSWNVRYNHRYEHRRARMGFGPSRSADPAPNQPRGRVRSWCNGHYSGSVVFTDVPRGLRHGKHHTSLSCTRAQVQSGNCKPTDRLVGRFEFDVR
jgi:hypothetical protein